MGIFRRLAAVLALFLVAAVASAQSSPGEERKADHDALRALLTTSAQALSTRQLDSLAGRVAPGFTVITVDNRKLVGLEAVKKYYSTLFDGPDAILTKLEVNPVADELTSFLGENSGVVYGVSDDVYRFKDGDTRNMQTRWSAVVARDGETWKLVNVHFSANLLDNPMLDAAKAYAQKTSIIGGVAGLIAGALLMAVIRRRAPG